MAYKIQSGKVDHAADNTLPPPEEDTYLPVSSPHNSLDFKSVDGILCQQIYGGWSRFKTGDHVYRKIRPTEIGHVTGFSSLRDGNWTIYYVEFPDGKTMPYEGDDLVKVSLA